MLVDKLESLDKPKGLVDIAAHGKIVDGDLPQRALGVDDEEAAEGDAVVLLEDPVGPADGHVLVGQEWDLHLAEAAMFAVLLTPGEVGEVRVRAAGHHGAVEGLELRHPVREGDDLRGADEREVQRVEEEYDVLP